MQHTVTDEDTAPALGSGDVPVLATPRLIAWMEAATVTATADGLADDQTTVGAAIRINHRRASCVGETVEIGVSAPESSRQRVMTFRVQALNADGVIVGDGEIDRVIVDRDDFLEQAGAAE